MNEQIQAKGCDMGLILWQNGLKEILKPVKCELVCRWRKWVCI